MDLHLLVLERNMTWITKNIGNIELLHRQLDITGCHKVSLAMSHDLLSLLYNLVDLVAEAWKQSLFKSLLVNLVLLNSKALQKCV